MKKLFVVFLVIVLVLPVFGAGKKDSSSGKPTFMFCISHMSNAWATTAANSMTEAAKAVGADLIVNQADKDINKQIGQIESGINQKVNAIIIEPVSVNGVIPAVEAARKAGIPVIIFNQNISEPAKASAFVGVSNATLGATEMKRVVADLSGKGNIAILLGPRGSEAQIGRSQGYSEVLASNPDIKVVFEDTGNWTTEEGLKLAENWLQTGVKIDAFVSHNDNMALGAAKAIEDKGLKGQIKVYGLDAVPDALKAIKEGRLTISVDQETEKQSQLAIDVAMRLYRGEQVPAENLVQGGIIDISNVDKFM